MVRLCGRGGGRRECVGVGWRGCSVLGRGGGGGGGAWSGGVMEGKEWVGERCVVAGT